MRRASDSSAGMQTDEREDGRICERANEQTVQLALRHAVRHTSKSVDETAAGGQAGEQTGKTQRVRGGVTGRRAGWLGSGWCGG